MDSYSYQPPSESDINVTAPADKAVYVTNVNAHGSDLATTALTLAPATVTASEPPTPAVALAPTTVKRFPPLVCIVDFHHARGPEVERWFGAPEGFDPAVEYDWSLLPFQALSDGAHA